MRFNGPQSINERSRRSLLRIGAKEEGLLRNYVVGKDGALCDVLVFSITDSEWSGVKVNLETKPRSSPIAQ